ncbi:MAG: ABC transporter permease [Bdellovibrionales bacterium]|nr:ABC transporter permease [Bdellovibrionales bacterium]
MSFRSMFSPPWRWKNKMAALYFVAVESLPVIIICVGFAAVVTIIEASYHMKIVIQSDALVPGFAAILILRELGSVISSLLLGSRVGAGWAAEVSSMKVTEQIDALKLLGISPIQYLVGPKLLACILGNIVLGVIANIACLFFAMLISVFKLGYTSGMFLTTMRVFVNFQDLLFAMIKSACFGATIPLIACFCGFRAKSGADGVGKATTDAVVGISVAIIFLDFILSYIFSHFYAS